MTLEIKPKQTKEQLFGKIVKDSRGLGEFWQIKVAIHNQEGTKAFGGRMLTEYLHPLSNKTQPLFDTDGKVLVGLMIDKPTMILQNNDDNPQDVINIIWLLCHPEVKVQGVQLSEKVLAKKKDNALVTLTNLDFQETLGIEDENFIDQLIGRLSMDTGSNAVGIDRLRYLLAALNLPYRDARYIKNVQVEKLHLRKKLKDFCKQKDSYGKYNAYKVDSILKDIDLYKNTYEVKEMLRLNVVREQNGIFKYNNVPLGTTIETIIEFFKQNSEIYIEAMSVLATLLKEEK